MTYYRDMMTSDQRVLNTLQFIGHGLYLVLLLIYHHFRRNLLGFTGFLQGKW